MNIHQMQVRYQPTADRVLWQVRTGEGELVGVWLTRRMLRQLWPHLNRVTTMSGITRMAPNAIASPEAREMMAQAARSRPLQNANFETAFDSQAASLPLGPEPLLPEAYDIGPGKGGQGVHLAARESNGRNMTLELSDELAIGLLRLLEQALIEADWGILDVPPAAEAGAISTPVAPVLLN